MPCPDREFNSEKQASELQLLKFLYDEWQIYYLNCDVLGSPKEI
jgi:hypothetical protein